MPCDFVGAIAVPLTTDCCLVLPDYKANPRVATREEMAHLVRASW
jgi:hypothetical protein